MKPVSRESLSDAELRENHIQQILDIDGPDDASETVRRQSQFLGPQLLCPAALCPLTKRKRGQDHVAERFELYVLGMELANAYTELNDPITQEATFRRQVAGLSEEESMAKMDEDFIRALRHGMPPAGGLGIGIDRLVMLLTNTQTIRDVILFPLLRPEQR